MDKIIEIIKADIKRKEGKYRARKYYTYKPEYSKEDEQYFIKNGIEYPVKSKKNEIYINYFKMLVTQKIDYLLSKKPTYDKKLKDIGINVWIMLDKLVLNTSLDSQTWLHPYVSNNKLSYIIVKDSEIIAEYTADNKTLKSLIRYYKEDDILYVEIWSNDGVNKLQYDDKNNLLDEKIESHYTSKYYAGDVLEKSIDSNFPTIPFLKLENNKDVTSDIEDIEGLIIAYNAICTGFVDNVEKFQEALMILRGYVGDKDSIKQIMKDIQEAKGVNVSKDGSLDYMKVDIPVEARNTLLNILRDVIFLIARGVDPNKLAEGENITNVVLKSRYVQLDLKSSDCEKRISEFYEKFIQFLNSYKSISLDDTLEFNKSMLINENERIDDCIKSLNIVSLETILEYHPFVSKHGVKEELKRLKKEKEEAAKEAKKEFDLMNSDPNNPPDKDKKTIEDNKTN
jgi:SPP1 family phage portal protein